MRHGVERFVHVSTDEVYGPLLEGAATEDFPLRPTVPYAASKAAGDLVALRRAGRLLRRGVRPPSSVG